MQPHGVSRAPLNSYSHLPPNDLRHRTSRPAALRARQEHAPVDGVPESLLARWASSGRQPSIAHALQARDRITGILHVNVGPSSREVIYGRGGTPGRTSRSGERSRRRPQKGHARYGSPSPRHLASRPRRRSRSPGYSTSRSRTRSRSRSRPHRSRRQCPRSRGRPPPAPPSAEGMSPSTDCKLSHQCFGVKVSNLPEDRFMREVQYRIHSQFRAYGQVVSTVAYDAKDGRFAVVMFKSADAQAKAVEEGGTIIFGKQTEVIALSSQVTRNSFAVKVTGLPGGFNECVLLTVHNLFKTFGVVVSAELYEAPRGRFAVVKFERKGEQTKALEVSGKCILGCPVKVTALKAPPPENKDLNCVRNKAKIHVDTTHTSHSSDTDEESPRGSPRESDSCQPRASRMLFVSNLDTDITKQDLSTKFCRFGEIVDIYINSLPGATRQFAFLQFALTPSVTSAIQAMNGAFLGKCQIALSYGEVQPSRCVCVEGLCSSVSSEYLFQRFSEHGAIEKLLYDETKGAALILYIEEDASLTAVNTSRNHKTTGESIIMDYANESFQLHFCKSLLAS